MRNIEQHKNTAIEIANKRLNKKKANNRTRVKANQGSSGNRGLAQKRVLINILESGPCSDCLKIRSDENTQKIWCDSTEDPEGLANDYIAYGYISMLELICKEQSRIEP